MNIEKKVSYKEAREEYKNLGSDIINPDIDSFVQACDIEKIYPNGVQAVFRFSLAIKEKEFIVLVGPSGCGKSTTLRMIAGLEEITSGKLYLDKVLANTKSPYQRDIAMVFQSYALYPHMNVFDNMSFGLKINKTMLPQIGKDGKPVLDEKGEVKLVKRHYTKSEINELVFNAAKILDLGDYLDRKPKELSGGQMQRVALGRAIVRHPKLFLLDEPLSNLDAKLRVQMRSEIVKIHNNVGATTIYVTHDQTEAMTMADRIVVMNKGHIAQVDTPQKIYENPANLFAATFIGAPSINLFNVKYDKSHLTFGDGTEIKLDKNAEEKIKAFFKEKHAYYQKALSRFDLKHEELIPVLNEIIKNNNQEHIKELLKLEYLPEREEKIKDLLNKALETGEIKPNLKRIIQLIEEKDYLISAIVDELEANKQPSKSAQPVVVDKKNPILKTPEQEKEILTSLVSYLESGESNKELLIGVRPEFLKVSEKGPSIINAKVVLEEYLGAEKFIHFAFCDNEHVAKVDSKVIFKRDDNCSFGFDMKDIHLFDPVTGLAIL